MRIMTSVASMQLALVFSTVAAAAPTPYGAEELAKNLPNEACAGAIVLPPPSNKIPSTATEGGSSVAATTDEGTERSDMEWLNTIECASTGLTTSQGQSDFERPDQARSPSSGEELTDVSRQKSDRWSGYQINTTSRFINARWVVPSVSVPAYKADPAAPKYYVFSFVGIGGGFRSAGSTDLLIQAGTIQTVTKDNVPDYYFWYQVRHGPSDTGGAVRVTNLPLRPGDRVRARVAWTPSPTDPNVGSALFGLCNYTTNLCTDFTIRNTPPPGETTEWIPAEAPTEGTTILPMANFDQIDFTEACWNSTYNNSDPFENCKPMADGPGLFAIDYYIHLTDEKAFAYSGQPSSDKQSFSHYFYNSPTD